MSAVPITARLDHHDRDDLGVELARLLHAREIASHQDLDLAVDFDVNAAGELELVASGEEEHALAFIHRCREGSPAVRIKAVREDGESHFRLV